MDRLQEGAGAEAAIHAKANARAEIMSSPGAGRC